MVASIQSVQQAQGRTTPEYREVPAATDSSNAAVSGIAQTVSNAMGLFAQYGEKQNAKKVSASEASLGELEAKLVKVGDAARTNSSIDADKERMLLINKFNATNPTLASDVSKMYKRVTGMNVGGPTAEEEADLKSRNQALDSGYGRRDASDEYNNKQYELFLQNKRKDEVMAQEIKQLDLDVKRGNASKAQFRQKVMQSFQVMASDFYEKTSSDSAEMIQQWKNGEISSEEVLKIVGDERRRLNVGIANTGEYSLDPKVTALTKPILDELQLVEDTINRKIEVGVYDKQTEYNKSLAKAQFLSDPENLAMVTTSELMGHTIGLGAQMSKAVVDFVASSKLKDKIVADAASPKTTAPLVDITVMTGDEKGAIKSIVESASKAVSPQEKKELADSLEGVILHFGRNGMDYSNEDKKLVMDMLAIPGAMDGLDESQKQAVVDAAGTYIVDTVDVAARESITQAKITTYPTLSPAGTMSFRGIGMDTYEPPVETPATDMATLSTEGGVIRWTLNPEHMGNRQAQDAVRKLNQNISENITPSVSVISKAMGVPFDTAAQMFGVLPREEEEEEVSKDVTKEDNVSITNSGSMGTSSGKAATGATTYYGQEAIQKVEAMEGMLTPVQKILVQQEGYVDGDYEDDKGISTSGVGQTGKYKDMTFKEAFGKHEEIAMRTFPSYMLFNDDAKAALMSAVYRGDAKKSHKWVKYVNEGDFEKAAEELLKHKEYIERKEEGGDGVTERLEWIQSTLGGKNE